jgi:peptidyl-prolyl cis-trans isomerase C
MGTEFESAAFSLQTNQVSDVVTTRYGYHIIKLTQRIPAEPIEFAKVQDDIRNSLERQKIQDRLLPAHLETLRAAAQLEYLHGAKPPPTPRPEGIQADPAVSPGQGLP